MLPFTETHLVDEANVLSKCVAYRHELREDLEQSGVTEHAFFKACIQELVVLL